VGTGVAVGAEEEIIDGGGSSIAEAEGDGGTRGSDPMIVIIPIMSGLIEFLSSSRGLTHLVPLCATVPEYCCY